MDPRLDSFTDSQGSGSPSERAFWRVGVLVFIAAVLATLMFWLLLPSRFRANENSDYFEFYEPVARQIVAGRGIVTPDGKPALRTPPGHPLFLALAFAFSRWSGVPEAFVLPALSVFCMGATSVVLFAIARSVWGSAPALLTAAVWITYPLGQWLTKQPNTEMLFLVVFYLAVFLFVRLVNRCNHSGPLAFAVGVLAGTSMLIRPIALGVGLVMAAILMAGFLKSGLGGRRCLILAWLILVGNLLAIAPWEAWVYRRTGRLVLLQNAISTRLGLIFRTDGQRVPKRIPENVASLAGEIERSRRGQSSGNLARLLLAKLRTRPRDMVEIVALKSVRSFYGTDSGRFEKPILFMQLPYLAAIGWSSVVALRRNRSFALTILALSLYCWAMTVCAFTVVRYMIPAFGLLFTLLPAVLRRGAARNIERIVSSDGQ